MYDNRVDIMCVCETWLNSSIPDSFVSVAGYSVVCTDVVGDSVSMGYAFMLQNIFILNLLILMSRTCMQSDCTHQIYLYLLFIVLHLTL